MNAKEYSKTYHSGQTYGKAGSYFDEHIQKVVDLTLEYSKFAKNLGTSLDELVTIAYLHDVLEDTEADESELHNLFGFSVHRRVLLLTDKKGKNRAERHKNTYPPLSLDRTATFIKLMDRLANISSSENSKKIKMYQKEHKYFYETLNRENDFRPIWNQIEQRLFRI